MPDVIIMEASERPATREFLKLVQRRGLGRAAPVVILYTSNPDLQEMGASILEGAAEFLVKPFSDTLMRFKLELAGVALH
jgi:CheY-like chemotaxis protein